MIRAVFRFFGLLLLAAGFIFLVYDGARSIADQAIRVTLLSDAWNDIHQASQAATRVRFEDMSPALWRITKMALDQPAFALLGIVGLILMLACRPPKPKIGFARR